MELWHLTKLSGRYLNNANKYERYWKDNGKGCGKENNRNFKVSVDLKDFNDPCHQTMCSSSGFFWIHISIGSRINIWKQMEG
jgi:hypothetical protein